MRARVPRSVYGPGDGFEEVRDAGSRWFVVRDAKSGKVTLLHPRWAMSHLRGPMTESEIRRLCAVR